MGHHLLGSGIQSREYDYRSKGCRLRLDLSITEEQTSTYQHHSNGEGTALHAVPSLIPARDCHTTHRSSTTGWSGRLDYDPESWYEGCVLWIEQEIAGMVNPVMSFGVIEMDYDDDVHLPFLKSAQQCAIDFCLNQQEVSVWQGRLHTAITATAFGRGGADIREDGTGTPISANWTGFAKGNHTISATMFPSTPLKSSTVLCEAPPAEAWSSNAKEIVLLHLQFPLGTVNSV